MKNMRTFEDIYNMSAKERKENRCSLEIRTDNVGNPIAIWCQIVGGELIVKQAHFDEERKHFTNYVGLESTVTIKDLSLITSLYTP